MIFNILLMFSVVIVLMIGLFLLEKKISKKKEVRINNSDNQPEVEIATMAK